MDWIAPWERQFGKPVITTNQATLWVVIRAMRIDTSLSGRDVARADAGRLAGTGRDQVRALAKSGGVRGRWQEPLRMARLDADRLELAFNQGTDASVAPSSEWTCAASCEAMTKEFRHCA
jgi:hypothetical protein